MGNDEKRFSYRDPDTGRTKTIDLYEHGNIRVNDLRDIGIIKEETEYKVASLPFGGPLAEFYRRLDERDSKKE